jgi:anti-sigma factor RsiW
MNDPCNTAHLISALLDGELPEAEANRLRLHIRACTACSAYLEALVQNDALIRELPEIEPSEQFDRTFWSNVEAIDRQHEKPSWWRFWLSGWRPVAVGALAGAMAAALFFNAGMDRQLSPEEIFLAENVELLEAFDLIDNLDMLEHWDAIELMEERS